MKAWDKLKLKNGHEGRVAYIADSGAFVVNDRFNGEFYAFGVDGSLLKKFEQSGTARDKAVMMVSR